MRDLTLASFPKAGTLLGIASHVLAGEIAGTRGDVAQLVAHLERGVEIQDDPAYIEPPAWFYPVRQNLGAGLLQAGRAADAEAVYREDLRRDPNNGCSLFGLAESLRAQGKAAEAMEVQQCLTEVRQRAVVKLTASRF